jgi:hypothetical protein
LLLLLLFIVVFIISALIILLINRAVGESPGVKPEPTAKRARDEGAGQPANAANGKKLPRADAAPASRTLPDSSRTLPDSSRTLPDASALASTPPRADAAPLLKPGGEGALLTLEGAKPGL